MTPYIGPIIDLAGSALFLYLYFSPRSRKLHRRRWLLVACAVWIGLAYSDFRMAMERRSAGAGVSRAAPTLASEAGVQGPVNGTASPAGTLFSSREGYSIMVPPGYHFSSERQGPVSFYALKRDAAGEKRVLSVAAIPFVGGLGEMAQKTAQRLQRRHRGLHWAMEGSKDDLYLRYEFNATAQRTEGLIRFVRGPKGAYVVGAIHRHPLSTNRGLPKELKEAVRSFSVR